MDRSRVLQQLQESQARLAKAEAELAEAAGKLRAWSEAGNHGPLNTENSPSSPNLRAAWVVPGPFANGLSTPYSDLHRAE